MNILRRGLLLSVLLLAAVSGTARADDFSELLRAVDTPMSKAMLLAKWPDAHARLLRAVGDATLPTHGRLAALSLLSYWQDAASTRQAILGAATRDVGIVRAAASYHLARFYGARLSAAELRAVVAGVESSDRDSRRIAVRSLGWVAHGRAGTVLSNLAAGSDRELAALAVRVAAERARRFSPTIPAEDGTTHPSITP